MQWAIAKTPRHDDSNNRNVGETVGGLCKPFPCTFHRVLHDLGYRVIKCCVKDLQHSKPPVPSMWYSRPAQTAVNLSFALQEKSIPNSALAIVASAILKSEVDDMRDCDFPVLRQPFLPILVHQVVVNQDLDMLFPTPVVE